MKAEATACLSRTSGATVPGRTRVPAPGREHKSGDLEVPTSPSSSSCDRSLDGQPDDESNRRPIARFARIGGAPASAPRRVRSASGPGRDDRVARLGIHKRGHLPGASGVMLLQQWDRTSRSSGSARGAECLVRVAKNDADADRRLVVAAASSSVLRVDASLRCKGVAVLSRLVGGTAGTPRILRSGRSETRFQANAGVQYPSASIRRLGCQRGMLRRLALRTRGRRACAVCRRRRFARALPPSGSRYPRYSRR
jgi:hypothetical protein